MDSKETCWMSSYYWHTALQISYTGLSFLILEFSDQLISRPWHSPQSWVLSLGPLFAHIQFPEFHTSTVSSAIQMLNFPVWIWCKEYKSLTFPAQVVKIHSIFVALAFACKPFFVTTQINSTNNLVEIHHWSLITPWAAVIDKWHGPHFSKWWVTVI